MKIAVLGHRTFPISEPFAGGLERFIYTLVQGLQRKGCDVTLFAHPDSDPSLNVAAPDFIDTSFCTTSEEKSHESFLSIMDYLDYDNFDIVHNNSLNYFPIVLSDNISTPLVTTLHAPPFPLLYSAVKHRKRRCNYISISKINAESWGLNNGLSEIIYNGVDTDIFCFGENKSKDFAVWTGRILPCKGTHLAIEAAKKANINLVIAGPICDSEYFEQEVKPRLNEGIQYAGHLGKKELICLIQNAYVILCTPIWSEPFGLVVIESLSCGTPVVAFNRGAIAEIIDENTGILVTPDDTDAMAQAIKQATLLSRYACRERVVKHFSIDAMLSNYLQVFEKIAATRMSSQKSCISATTSTLTARDTYKGRSKLQNTLNRT
ncbi:glycosyltransferase family 4 protein [Calothrix sp. CCY 0018]|uniref:glycosyltransferase family 4 protein n=1 Tax=Calothrix sp. CCY 0018 TaxID=3103864 RepID=UPI0039C6E557